MGKYYLTRDVGKYYLTREELVTKGVVDEETLEKIEKHLKNGSTILISGQTGSGKTTLLNSLAAMIDKENRVLIVDNTGMKEAFIEDDERVANIEGPVKYSLKYMPDTVIVDEFYREIEDYVRVLNCGVSGLCTFHSNTADDALERIYNSLSEELTHSSKIEFLHRAFDLVVVMGTFMSGDEKFRKVIEVKEIADELKYSDDGKEHLDLIEI